MRFFDELNSKLSVFLAAQQTANAECLRLGTCSAIHRRYAPTAIQTPTPTAAPTIASIDRRDVFGHEFDLRDIDLEVVFAKIENKDVVCVVFEGTEADKKENEYLVKIKNSDFLCLELAAQDWKAFDFDSTTKALTRRQGGGSGPGSFREHQHEDGPPAWKKTDEVGKRQLGHQPPAWKTGENGKAVDDQ